MAAIHVAALLSHPAVRNAIERALAARGTHGDSLLIHANPREVAMLRFMGGAGTVNPRTGLRQFYEIGGDGSGGYSRGADGSGNLGQGAGGGSADALGGGVGSGYGGGPGNQGGSGLGAGGGHSGQAGYYSAYGDQRPAAVPASSSYVAPTPINNMPAPTPPALTPMMSSTATTDLAASRFGALPTWATTPYQIGMAPSSYPTPGVNAALGAPGTGGGTAPGGGGTAPGGGGGVGTVGGGALPSGSGITPSRGSIQTPTGAIPNPYVNTPAGAGVQLPNGTVALAHGGTLPNGQTVMEYLASLKLGIQPRMPAPVASTPMQTPGQRVAQILGVGQRAAPQVMPQAAPAVQAAAQPVASRLNFGSQAAPGAFQQQQQLHPAVQQAITRGILGGSVMAQPVPTPAQQVALQRLRAMGPVTSGRR